MGLSIRNNTGCQGETVLAHTLVLAIKPPTSLKDQKQKFFTYLNRTRERENYRKRTFLKTTSCNILTIIGHM